ncbi:MAG: DUF58 domain-containing protein [Chitinophagaceae bacterium]
MANSLLFLLLLLTITDYLFLFGSKKQITIKRKAPDRLSNGDENPISIQLQSTYRIKLDAYLIDELPKQFQLRNFSIQSTLLPQQKSVINYTLKPHVRGVYHFGYTHVYVSTPLHFFERRFTSLVEKSVAVYPSFLHIKKNQLMAEADKYVQGGTSMVARKGLSTEFDHIRDYSRGDDFRMINWKASARRNELMLNSFMEEKSQHIYCIIDKGRLMKMPFDHMSLLDYAINATLMISYVGLQKNDKIGLITFAERVQDIFIASKTKLQFARINELLYKQETDFLESNFEDLYIQVSKKLSQRSLIMLFTNFETYSSFERQKKYIQALNKKHLVCIVIFENTELSVIHTERQDSIEDIYIKTIANKFLHEKTLIIKELRKMGVLTIYTAPKKLNTGVINMYLQLKKRSII